MSKEQEKERLSNNEKHFREWFRKQTNKKGNFYSNVTIEGYIRVLKVASEKFRSEFGLCKSVFDINDPKEIARFFEKIKNTDKLRDFELYSHRRFGVAMTHYKNFLNKKIENGEF